MNRGEIEISRLEVKVPLVFTSGATPGPFYHSHPHNPTEFDHVSTDIDAQVRANLETLRRIGEGVFSHGAVQQALTLSGGHEDHLRNPLLVGIYVYMKL